jgi:hypothetical protein
MTGHSDYDFAAPRVGMSAGSAKQPVEDANYESAAPHHGTFAGIMKHPAEHRSTIDYLYHLLSCIFVFL